MSSNNKIIILKKKGVFEIHMQSNVENDFKPTKNSLLKKHSILEWACKFAQDYQKENTVEYGIFIHPSCWGKGIPKKKKKSKFPKVYGRDY